MADISGNEIFARARTIASQTGGDANQAAIIDGLGGLRATLNHAIREVYRRKAGEQKFIEDITVTHDITLASGVGTVPETLMTEFLSQANLADDDGSLISYMDYAVDATNEIFPQLGYLWIVGSDFHYTAPTPTSDTYSGSLFVTCPTFPTFPASMASDISFPTLATVDDVVLFLANAILGNESYQIVTA